MSPLFGHSRNPLDSIVSAHNDLVSQLNQLSRHVAAGHQQREIDVLKEIYSVQHAEAARYASVVMVAGYAAFFAMWASVKQDLSRSIILWSGLLMTVSIALFVGFEVAKMTLVAIANRRVLQATNEADRPAASAINQLMQAEGRKMLRLWKWTLVPTLITGFGAAGLMTFGFICSLLEWYRQTP